MDTLDENALHIFTDGSVYRKPGRGGTAAVIVSIDTNGEEKVLELPGQGYSGPTNNEMELQACVEILKLLNSRRSPVNPRAYSRIIIHPDATYISNNLRNALFIWPKSGWLGATGNPIANAHLWKEIGKQVKKISVRVEAKWVKGHFRSAHNIAADRLAKESARIRSTRKISHVDVRRKRTSNRVVRGSVRMEGQRSTVRIITDQLLPVQKIYKYRYEVMSAASKYFKLADIIYSDIQLQAGHTYSVRFNKNTDMPRIIKVFKEL